MYIIWSDYNSLGEHKGHKYIKATGNISQIHVMKMYGYEAESVEATYK